MSQIAEVKGMREILDRMTAYPVEMIKAVAITMSASLNVFWENVPPYPPQPQGSKYERTGLLGKSLGSDESGGASGSPSVYKIRKIGASDFEGAFGSSLNYAPHVIGDTTQAPQNSHWWVMRNVADKSTEKIEKLWDMLAEKLARFLEGRA